MHDDSGYEPVVYCTSHWRAFEMMKRYRFPGRDSRHETQTFSSVIPLERTWRLAFVCIGLAGIMANLGAFPMNPQLKIISKHSD